MTQPNATTDSTVASTTNAASTEFLKPDEAQILLDWSRTEEAEATGTAGMARVRAIVKEIDDLVGHRLDLVADDLEERMIALLVGDLDPKSQICLEISRDVAQVTAEKDHLEGPELVRRLTQISSHTLRLTAGTTTATTSASGGSAPSSPAASIAASTAPSSLAAHTPASQSIATRARPIPRPTQYPPRKPSLLQRLFGRK